MPDTPADLARLEQDERAVSQRRRRLHERIDFMRGNGAQDEESLARLAKLQAEEKEVSAQRRDLHARIDALRSQAGTAAVGPPPRERQLESPGASYVASMHIGFGSLSRDDRDA